MPDSPAFSLVVPAYNEGPRIVENLKKIHDFVRRKGTFEMIVVDDGSQDDTAQKVSSLLPAFPEIRLLRINPNKGKGAAVKLGMQNTRGDICVFLDADLGIPIEEMDKLTPFVAQGFDCVIGSKKVPGAHAEVKQPFLRRFLGKGYSMISSAILVPGIRDFTCGIKLFTQRATRAVFPRQTIERWGFDTEILFLTHYLGFKIKEVPVQWTHQPNSKVMIVRDVLNSLKDLINITKNRLSGVYRKG